MKVGLIQIDGKLPNIALMKLASWHRKKGDQVTFIDISSHKFDRIYGSKIFMGGTGFDIKAKLPKDIEAQIPDYDLFNTNYSIGFTSRGCIRDCGFCIVKEKEGSFYDVDFSKDIKHSKYLALDNNFLASPKWKEKLKFFIDNKIKISFNQGLDIRLIDDEKAEILSKVLYYDLKFYQRRLYFAFDDPIIEPIFKEKIKILLKYIPAKHIMIYILVGNNTTFKQDMDRFNIINSYGCDPFIMIYNNRRDNQKLRNFSRWVNMRIYKTCPKFEDYRRLNYAKNNTINKPE